jgi:hypothetical protein
MPTKNALLISPTKEQDEICIYATFAGIIFQSSDKENSIYIEFKQEDWEEIKNFIDLEIQKLNENG